jgi:hypothetical protein
VCKRAGEFNRTTPFSFALWLKPTESQDRAVVFHRSRAWTDSGSRGYELLLEGGKPTFSLIHFWPGNAIKVGAKKTLSIGQWSHLVITYDGSSRAAGIHLYLGGEPLDLDIVRDNLFKDIVHRNEWGDADVGNVDLTLAGRFRDSGFKNGIIDEFQVFDQCLTELEARRLAGTSDEHPSRDLLLAHYLNRADSRNRLLLEDILKLRREENALINDVREIMVMKELPRQRPTFLLKRGAYDAPAEPVNPGTPESILPFAKELPRNRLGLAQWIVDRKNPLTARVVVNRIWRLHFGRGLVTTEEDFGIQGKLPTHPDLLDWLAGHFMEIGWNLKALNKLIVSSATYRQSSEANPELLVKDPENLLLARGPKHRLKAEEVRDSALAISGLMSGKIGGPSVKPYQPEGLWEESGTGKHYVQDQGEGLYRRSLYTFWRRTAPPPSMLIFDAPTREVCTARRETTTTPLQALVLLNDPQFVEASRALAEKLLHENKENRTQMLDNACRLTLGRTPHEKERATLKRLFHEQLTQFEGDPSSAEQYLKIGSRPWDKALPPAELAAATVLANTLMNMDEFVMKR